MRLKILIIVILICAIIVTATISTLSTYTVSSSGSLGIIPNTEKIVGQK